VWIVFGNSTKTQRVAGGIRVERRCGQCGARATFYECEIVKSFRLYAFLNIYEDRERVMQCGECLALFKTDELGAGAKTESGGLINRLGAALDDLNRRADEALAERERTKPANVARRAQEPLTPREQKKRDAEIERQLAELKKKMGK
jgi:hypothetical protein